MGDEWDKTAVCLGNSCRVRHVQRLIECDKIKKALSVGQDRGQKG